MKRASFFTWRWMLTTLLVIAAVAVMIRLGKWQLDRLEARRAFNARVQAQIDAPPLDINAYGGAASELYDMEYRPVRLVGEFDHASQVVLRNQAWNNQFGVRLLTPLRLQGSGEYILVDRGWVPYEDYTGGSLEKYDEPGQIELVGVIRRSQTRPDIGTRTDPTPAPGEPPLDAFFLANVDRIQAQLPYTLLPVYVQQAPDPAFAGPPMRSLPELNLTEGSHLGYAIQWFAFAAILAAGYPFFVRRELSETDKQQAREGNLST